MIPVTNQTKTALQQAVKQIRAQISWAVSASETETLTSEDKIISIKKEAEGYYCKSTLRKITIVLAGTDTSLLDKRITALVQVKTGANTWGDIPWGSFNITEEKIDQEKGISTFTGYGGIAMMQNKEYVAGELNFPTTVGGLLQQIADKFALTIDESIKILPGEYQEVEYIQNTDKCYIYTGIEDKSGLRVVADVEYTAFHASNICPLFGAGAASPNTFRYIAVAPNKDGKITVGYDSAGTTMQTLSDTIALDTRNVIDVLLSDNERSVTLNGELKWRDTTAKTYQSKNIDVPLFVYIYNGVPNFGLKALAKLYACKIYDNGTLVRDFVPCRRKSDSKPGLYDLVNGVFYTNDGDGDFVLGADHDSLPNIDAPVSEDLWAKISGTTYRDILEEIAGATGTIAVIGGGDDTLDLRLPPVDTASETLTESNLITSKIGENWGKVSAVVLSRQPQGDNISVVDQATAEGPGGKNLFNNAATPGVRSAYITFEPTETGIKMTMTATPTNVRYGAWAIKKIEPSDLGKTYTASVGQITASNPSVGTRVDFITCSADANNRQTIHAVDANSSYSYTITQPGLVGKYLGFRIYCASSGYEHAQPGDTAEFSNLMLEQGATATSFEPFTPNGRIDLVITNNQILDPQRETTAQPILDAVKGWEYRNSEIKTEGHGYHEVGDRLDVVVAGKSHTTVVTKSSILVNGGISETLTSSTPEVVPINYSKSGGVTKTIFNTELAVDKQEQRIDSIVSRQDSTDALIVEQFSQVSQNLAGIVATVQSTGGGNFIRNSVGFGKDSNGLLTNWTYGAGASNVTVRSQSSPASLNAGAVSGYEIMVTGATISQDLNLTPGETYTLALRAQKGSMGAATITVGNSSETATITLADGTAYAWQRQSVEFTPTMGANTITINTDAGTTVEITDLILTTGGAITWRQASGEIYNTQVSLDQAGVQVRSSVYTGDYVEITPLEFAGYSNASGSMQKVFSLNRDITEVEKLEARSQIKMPPLKIVPVNNASYSGWAFVKEQ